MTSRVCLVFLLLIGLCCLAAAAQGGVLPAPAAPPVAVLTATTPAPALCLAAPAAPSLVETARLDLTTSVPGAAVASADFAQALRQQASCNSCSGTRCTSLHSCVLMHCCG